MANEVFINIKDLPELTEINNGDYIIVETSTGTRILNFENLIIPPENNVLTTTVADTNFSLVALSTVIDTTNTNLGNLQTSFNESITNTFYTLSSDINTVSTNLENLSTYVELTQKLYVSKCVITIPTLAKTGSNVLQPTMSNLGLSFEDISVTPANSYAARFPAYVESINDETGVITIRGGFTRYDVSGGSTVAVDVVAEQEAVYTVMAILKI
jgi:hypothetical protein